jgi:hypothetical protein
LRRPRARSRSSAQSAALALMRAQAGPRCRRSMTCDSRFFRRCTRRRRALRMAWQSRFARAAKGGLP